MRGNPKPALFGRVMGIATDGLERDTGNARWNVPREKSTNLGADRADRALIDGVLHAVGGRPLNDVCLVFGIHLKHIGADLRAQTATDAKILIDLGHGILLLSCACYAS